LLENQLLLVSLISLAIAAGIAFLLARHIAAPLERINSKAKRLPQGEYDIDFSEKSYREIEELSATLNHTADDLSRTDRLQKELIANISHDLRTPLTMIVGYAEVMRDIEGENKPENIQVIIDEATRLSLLVNDLLEISRIQGGNNERKNETFDLGELATQTVARYQRLKANSGFDFSVSVDGDCHVYADKEKIVQVICNLVNNAINYSVDEKRVMLRVFRQKGAVRLEVEDRGVGISPENIEHVWERYYRETTSQRRGVSGSGLGLSIVREILELHRARYGVSSVLGEGSVFWFEILEENEKLCPECV
jgi:signal transduction histidine kinase